MADLVDKELNVDYWWYQSHEYHRGDLVQVDPDNKHHQQLMDGGVLVNPGFAESLAQEQAAAEETAAALAAEAREFADQEASRKTSTAERLLHGDTASAVDEGPEVSEGDGSPKHSGAERTYIVPNKGATRRRS